VLHGRCSLDCTVGCQLLCQVDQAALLLLLLLVVVVVGWQV